VTIENDPSQTLVEKVLVLLEEKFPWLGREDEEPVSGADTVDQLADLHRQLNRRRRTNLSDGRKSRN